MNVVVSMIGRFFAKMVECQATKHQDFCCCEESEESSEESEESTDDEMWGEEEWERTTLGGHQYGSKGTYKKTNKKWKFPTWKREKGDKKEKRTNSDEWTVWKIILARFSKLTREKGDKKEKRANSDEWTVW